MILRLTLFVVPAVLAVVLATVAQGSSRPHRLGADGQVMGLRAVHPNRRELPALRTARQAVRGRPPGRTNRRA